MRYYELCPIHENRKSYYKKAYVVDNVKCACYELYSYGRHVMDISYDGDVVMYDGSMYDSKTTRRHKREFLRQHNIDANLYM